MRDVFASDGEDLDRLGEPFMSMSVAFLSSTNDEATACRYSAHKAGLIEDEFVSFFLPPGHHCLCVQESKDPLINRGTYLRVTAVDRVCRRLLDEGPLQIVSLGAGFDTRFFAFHTHEHMRGYVEVDFEEVIGRKKHVIAQHRLPSPAFVCGDLEVDVVRVLLPAVLAHLDRTVRTLVVAECCLMYLQDSAVSALLTALSSSFSQAELMIFDPLYLGDRFGETMASNLASRGLPIDTFKKYPDAARYKQRIECCGWRNAVLTTMAEHARGAECAALLAQKAPLDEYEEWAMITQHYFTLHARNFG